MTTWALFCEFHLGELVVLGRKCHSTECLQPIAARVHWVTGPLDVCAKCSRRFARVAQALGMAVRIDAVEYTPPGLDDSAQRMRLLELT